MVLTCLQLDRHVPCGVQHARSGASGAFESVTHLEAVISQKTVMMASKSVTILGVESIGVAFGATTMRRQFHAGKSPFGAKTFGICFGLWWEVGILVEGETGLLSTLREILVLLSDCTRREKAPFFDCHLLLFIFSFWRISEKQKFWKFKRRRLLR
jgi:hypothetical protein